MTGRVMPLRIALAVLLLAFSVALLRHHTDARWSMDGYTYAVMAQTDAGISFQDARARARAFYSTTPAARRALERHVLRRGHVQWSRLFTARPLYPMLAGMLWPRYGFESLLIVSRFAYVVTVLLTFFLAQRFANVFAAACAAALITITPAVRVIGNDALTDATALALWTATLIAISAYVRTPDRQRLAGVLLVAVLLCLTRPVFYAVACCAAVLAATRPREAARIAGVALIAGIAPMAIALYVHASVPVPHPYFPMLTASLRTFGAELVSAIWPLAGIAGILIVRAREQRAILIGAVLAALVSLLIDPIPADVERLAVVPLLPAAASGAAALLTRLTASSALRSLLFALGRSIGLRDRRTAPRP